jgi:hypothetical protein
VTIKVGFDYDEPIFPWYDYAHDVAVAAGLTRAEDPPPTAWDPHSHYAALRKERGEPEVTPQDWYDALGTEIAKGLEGMYGRPPKAESVAAIRKLYRLGYEVHLVTARGSFGKQGQLIKRMTRTQVIREEIPNDGLHFAKDKTKVIRDLGLDYFLDDRPVHYLEAVDAGADVYLLEERWNKDFDVPYEKRVKTTAEYVDLIVKKHGDQTGKATFTSRRESYA